MYNSGMQSNSQGPVYRKSFFCCCLQVLHQITIFCQVRYYFPQKKQKVDGHSVTGSSVCWWEIYLGERQRQALPQSCLLQCCCRLAAHPRDGVSSQSLFWSVLREIPFYHCPSLQKTVVVGVGSWYVFGFLQWNDSTIVNTCISCTGEIPSNTEAKLPPKQKRTVPLSWIICSALSFAKHVILSLQELLPKQVCLFMYSFILRIPFSSL